MPVLGQVFATIQVCPHRWYVSVPGRLVISRWETRAMQGVVPVQAVHPVSHRRFVCLDWAVRPQRLRGVFLKMGRSRCSILCAQRADDEVLHVV